MRTEDGEKKQCHLPCKYKKNTNVHIFSLIRRAKRAGGKERRNVTDTYFFIHLFLPCGHKVKAKHDPCIISVKKDIGL